MGMRDMGEVRLALGVGEEGVRVASGFQACTSGFTTVLIREVGNTGMDPAWKEDSES